MSYQHSKIIAIVTVLLALATIVGLLIGILDPWGWVITLATIIVVAGQSSLLFARCKSCGKSMFLGAGRARIVGEPPAPGWRKLLPERECSSCHQRNS